MKSLSYEWPRRWARGCLPRLVSGGRHSFSREGFVSRVHHQGPGQTARGPGCAEISRERLLAGFGRLLARNRTVFPELVAVVVSVEVEIGRASCRGRV